MVNASDLRKDMVKASDGETMNDEEVVQQTNSENRDAEFFE